MYILLLILHSTFIIITHLLGYYILEGIFLLFFLFFLLYFSPIFFEKTPKDLTTFSFSKISLSLQNSLFIPVLLFYTAIFFLFFAITGDIFQTFTYNILFFIILYVLFLLYILAFDWKNEIFFEISRIHMIFSYISIFLILFLGFFFPYIITIGFLFLFFITIGFSFLYFFHTQNTEILLFQGFLFSLMFTSFVVSVFFTWWVSYIFLLFSFWFSAIVLFEIMPLFKYFTPFLLLSRVYVLTAFLVTYLIGIVWAFFEPSFYVYVLVGIVFLFLVHIRYSNYISLFNAIFGTFFLYSIVFSPLLTTTSLLSALLFIFFLPLCIIWNTYFWEERFPYDLKVLHYSSISFSVVYSVYSLIFIPWWDMIFFALSLSIFALGFLLFLSYFRFRT